MKKILGIDLGTTNSVAAFMSKGAPMPIGFTANEQIFPSVVSLERNNKLEVGAKAKRSHKNKIYSAKRFIGRKFADPEVQEALGTLAQELPYKVIESVDGGVRFTLDGYEFSPVEISALVLRRIKEAAESQYGEFSRAIITVPAYFREGQIAATREAGRLAGFHVVQIVTEPTAAALTFGARNAKLAQQKLILAYDFGGGTFDVSLLIPDQGAYTVLEIGGDAFLGGDNIDNLLMRRVRDAVRKEQGIDLFSGDGATEAKVLLKLETERMKIGLSSNLEESIDLPMLNSANVYHAVRREELEALIEPMVQKSIDITNDTLAKKGLTPTDVDLVLLIGGTTQIPLIRQRLEALFGPGKVQFDVNPMLSVAEGAAILAAICKTIDCTRCMTSNDIERDTCAMCDAPLFGSGNEIADRMHERFGEQMSAPLPIATNNVSSTGLKCMECGHICPPGVTTCPKCGFDVAVKETIDMTAHTIGIELQDGSFAPIVPTGTYVPMPKPAIGLFRTSIDNQQRLEVNVYEGDDEIANKNELIGTVDIPLVSQYKKDTPISVAIRVDKNRITEVSAQISPPHGEKIDAKLKRNQLTPELKEKILASRQKLINFLDEWKDEITLAEQVALRSAISEAAKILSGESVDALSRENLDEHINISTEMLKHCTRVRGEQASLSHAIPRLEGLVPPNDLQPLRNIYNSLEEAREQANFDEALRLANESTEMLRKFGRFMDIVHAEALAASGRLSPTLSARVQNAAGAIRRSVQNNNANQVKSGMTTLDVLWDEIHVEIAQRKDRPSEIVLPNKGR